MRNLGDLIHGRGISLLIYGRSGTGKTSACRTLDPTRTFFFTFEPHGLVVLFAYRWREADWVECRTFQQTLQEISLVERRKEISTVVVDALSTLYERIYDEESKPGREEPWQVCKEKLQIALRAFLSLNDSGKDVVLLCHQNYREKRTEGATSQWREPNLPGKLPEIVARTVPVVLRSEVVTLGPKRRYVLTYEGEAGDYGADKFQALDPIEPNDVSVILKKLRASMGATEKEARVIADTLIPAAESAPEMLATVASSARVAIFNDFMRLGLDSGWTNAQVRNWVLKETRSHLTALPDGEILALREKLRQVFEKKETPDPPAPPPEAEPHPPEPPQKPAKKVRRPFMDSEDGSIEELAKKTPF